MQVPGIADALNDPELRDKAEQQAERLLNELKKSVQVTARDVGVLRKEMHVTVPAQVIADHISMNYDELMHDVAIPGFRKGRAPRQLIEKRFGAEVRDSLKTTILGQSFYAAIEKQDLKVLGDPLFRITGDDGEKLMEIEQAVEQISLPETGDFSYVCELEIKPTFELPELKGIEIKTPEFEIDADLIDDYIERQRKIRGRYEPVSDGATAEDDMLVADVVLTVDGKEVKREDNVQLGVRPTRLDGIPLTELDKALSGAKAGEQRSTECSVPDDYERPDCRGKKGRFDFTIHEVKRLAPIELESYAAQLGCVDEPQLREYVREQLEDERDTYITRAKKQQVLDYLVNHTTLDVPQGLSARQTDRAVMRRVVELQQRGVPWNEIEANIDELRTSATDDVSRDLKIEFILEKVAEKLGAEVAEEEVNTEIARIARTYNRRFDRVRDELQQRGLLGQLAEQIRQDKCVQMLLADAKFVAVKPDPDKKPKKKAGPAASPAAPAAKLPKATPASAEPTPAPPAAKAQKPAPAGKSAKPAPPAAKEQAAAEEPAKPKARKPRKKGEDQ